MKLKIHKEQSGLTVVELIVAIVVGAIFAGSANLIIVQHTHLAQRGRDLSLANAYVESKVEEIRSIGFSGLSNGTVDITNELPSDLKAPHTASIAITNQSTAVKKVVISLTYNDQGANRNYSYTTYV